MRPTALPVRFESIPPSLQADPRWVLWRHVRRQKPNGESVWAKLPMTTEGGPASSTNPQTWASFDDVADVFILGGYDGVGYVLSPEVQGIDLDDHRDPVTGSLSDLAQEVLRRVDGYAEVSPSGTGIKVFTKTNLDGSRTKKEAGVELYRDGRYFAVTGHALNGHAAPAQDPQDLGWMVSRFWGEAMGRAPSTDLTDLALANYKPPLEGWDLERVISDVLPHLDPDGGYEAWLRVGAAMHHQGQGDTEWLSAWDDWSASSGKWVEGYCEEKWHSFSRQRVGGHGALTLASLLKLTRDERQEQKVEERRAEVDEALPGLLQAIEDTTEPRDLQEKVAARIAHLPGLLEVEREQLAAAIQARAKALGVKLSIASVRGWCRSRVRANTSADAPEWARDWVYVTDGDKFFDTSTKQEVSSQGFRAKFNRFMPIASDGSRERADQHALEQWGMTVVSHKAYLPSAGVTFEMFGLQWVNLYRPESVPAVPATYSAEETAAIAVVENHLRVYLGAERERDLLRSWLAWNVQNPGRKIRWAPYVHGVPGDGKSFFAELVAVAMGGQNVRSLNGSTLESNFTDWAVGYALVAIEEMKQHGHNRYDIMNRLKPFITNTSVEVHPKGKASYTAPNVSNYIIFSNYLDGAPVDAADRRYMFLSSQLTSADAKRLTEEGYFKTLFGVIQEHPGAIRKWLLEAPMHPEFDANGRAPDTDVKRTVVEMSKTDLESAAEDLIEQGAVGVCRDVVSSAHLTRALTARGAEAPESSRVNTLLTKLGFRFGWRKKWKGEACRIWVRQGLSLDEGGAVTGLNATKDAFLDFLE